MAEKARWSPLPVADTVSRIILGERYSLEPYRSLKDKLSLLDAAVGNHDGNTILVVRTMWLSCMGEFGHLIPKKFCFLREILAVLRTNLFTKFVTIFKTIFQGNCSFFQPWLGPCASCINPPSLPLSSVMSVSVSTYFPAGLDNSYCRHGMLRHNILITFTREGSIKTNLDTCILLNRIIRLM